MVAIGLSLFARLSWSRLRVPAPGGFHPDSASP